MAETGLGRLRGLVLAALLVALIGWFLYIGKDVLIPILSAVIAVYVISSAAEALGRIPIGRPLPLWLRRSLVLLVFIAALAALASVVVVATDQMIAKAPAYQANLQKLVGQIARTLGVETDPDWQTMRNALFGRFSIESLAGNLLGSIGGLAGVVLLIAVYAAFLMAEQGSFSSKLSAALRDPEHTERAELTIHRINERIGDYLAVKTLVNVILALLSFVILKLWSVDFALFWAIVIGLLNYIPYVGSLLGVMFPVLVSLVQFGSIPTMLVIAALLTAAQFIVGNVLEPRMIGQRLNLSPFVVLASLSIWSSLWGLAGAILAIPLTSVLAVLLAAFPASRALAVLLADDVDAFVAEEQANDG